MITKITATVLIQGGASDVAYFADALSNAFAKNKPRPGAAAVITVLDAEGAVIHQAKTNGIPSHELINELRSATA